MLFLLAALTLADLERLAIEHNAAYRQAAIQVRIAEGHRRQAGLYPNPTIGANGEHVSPEPSVRYGSIGGFVDQRIVIGGKLGVEKALADRDIDEARARRDFAALELTGHLRLLYYQALGEQRLIAVRERLHRTASETAETFRELKNTGLADEPDVLNADVEVRRAVVRLEQARQARERTFRQLAALLQQPLPVTELDGDFTALPPLAEQTVWDRIATGSPELVLPSVAIRRAELSLRQARLKRVPDLQIRGGVRNNREISEVTGRSVGPEGIFDVGVEIPLFNRQQGAIAAAKAERERAALEPEKARRSLEARFADVWREFAQARLAADRYRTEMIPATAKALELYQANYKAMSGTYPSVLTTQRSLVTLEEEYLESLQTAWRAVAQLESLLAVDPMR